MMAALIVAMLCVAYANGANDNFKGVATLFGSGTTGYLPALRWGTAATFAGGLASLWVAPELVARFSGKGLVPEVLTREPAFLVAVGLSAAATVLLAAVLGFPVSTTHALMGALTGAGLVRAGSALNPATLVGGFVLPLAVSPLLAAAAAAVLYSLGRLARRRFELEPGSCVCAEATLAEFEPAGGVRGVSLPMAVHFESCRLDNLAEGGFALRAKEALGGAHWVSAGALSFARGLNDAPKIAAVAVGIGALGLGLGLVTVAVVMAAGGLLGGRRVAETMSRRITDMNSGQGFAANLVAALLVLFASRLALPVSTTHVACGALFGIGAVTGQARWATIAKVLASWLTTLPIAAALGALGAWALG